jgi:hypothetical protein
MPCRNTEPVPPTFPSNFPVDTDYFSVALSELNFARSQDGQPRLGFDALSREDQREVLARAQQLKNGRATASDSAGAAEVSSLASRHPLLARFGAAIARLFAMRSTA